MTTLGRTIIVHAKLTIVDDVLLRIGSANINNRSMGFDSECDLALEMRDGAQSGRLSKLRLGLVAHWLGCDDAVLDAALKEVGGRWCAALDALREGGYARLRPITPGPINPLSGLVAKHHIGDPVASADAWRPWRRRAALRARLADAEFDTRQVSMVPTR